MKTNWFRSAEWRLVMAGLGMSVAFVAISVMTLFHNLRDCKRVDTLERTELSTPPPIKMANRMN